LPLTTTRMTFALPTNYSIWFSLDTFHSERLGFTEYDLGQNTLVIYL